MTEVFKIIWEFVEFLGEITWWLLKRIFLLIFIALMIIFAIVNPIKAIVVFVLGYYGGKFTRKIIIEEVQREKERSKNEE
jgi:energy-coupling factor transporter transmembrane protein EcfT